MFLRAGSFDHFYVQFVLLHLHSWSTPRSKAHNRYVLDCYRYTHEEVT